MYHHLRVVIGAVSIFLVGCAAVPQPPVSLNSDVVQGKAGRVGIVMSATPKPGMSLPGASCLLCAIVAAAANSTVSTYSESLSTDDLKSLKQDFAALIAAKGGTPVVIDEPVKISDLPNFAKPAPNVAITDFTAFRNKYDIDSLLVIDVTAVGLERTYSAYVSTSDPKAIVQGQVLLVNMADNSYKWYIPFKTLRASDGPWDEPPKFPGLTNAYYQAVELTKDNLFRPFK